jgi:threonine dehydrogenase-like Zn-dependent dehydrogenase
VLAGDVIARGDVVEDLEIGDRVVALHNHADFAICPVRSDFILKIPDSVSYEDSTFCVLGSVALHAIHRAQLRLGEDVVVMGAGLVGLLTLQLAKLAGGRPVISVDLSTRRLELASRLGADFTLNPNREEPVSRIREWIGGEGANCTIEAVGNPAVLQSCMRVCAPGARIVVMGAIVGTVELDMYREFIFRELTLIASQQPRNPVKDSIYYHLTGQQNRQTLLDMIRTQSINTQDLITHRFFFFRRTGSVSSARRSEGRGLRCGRGRSSRYDRSTIQLAGLIGTKGARSTVFPGGIGVGIILAMW